MKPKLRDYLKMPDYQGLDERIRQNTLTPLDQRVLRVGVRLAPSFLEAVRRNKLNWTRTRGGRVEPPMKTALERLPGHS